MFQKNFNKVNFIRLLKKNSPIVVVGFPVVEVVACQKDTCFNVNAENFNSQNLFFLTRIRHVVFTINTNI